MNNITALTSDVSTGWKTGDDIGIAPTTRPTRNMKGKRLGQTPPGPPSPCRAPSLICMKALPRPGRDHQPHPERHLEVQQRRLWLLLELSHPRPRLISIGSALPGLALLPLSRPHRRSFNIQRCAVKDCRATPFILNHANLDNVTIKDNVGYNVASYGTYGIQVAVATTGTTGVIIDGNWFMCIAGGTHGIYSAGCRDHHYQQRDVRVQRQRILFTEAGAQ